MADGLAYFKQVYGEIPDWVKKCTYTAPKCSTTISISAGKLSRKMHYRKKKKTNSSPVRMRETCKSQQITTQKLRSVMVPLLKNWRNTSWRKPIQRCGCFASGIESNRICWRTRRVKKSMRPLLRGHFCGRTIGKDHRLSACREPFIHERRSGIGEGKRWP